jgi:hypothetical protein
MVVMVSHVLLGIALVGTISDYNPGNHLQFVDSRFNSIEVQYEALAEGTGSEENAAQTTSQLLAAQRQFHMGLSDWIAEGEDVDAGQAMRVLQVSGLFDAYLSSRILQLDGNADAERDADQIAKVLDRILDY